MQYRSITLLALARQLKPLDFPHAILVNNIASASSSANIASGLALARLARQLESLDFPHAIPVNNIASASSSANIASDTPAMTRMQSWTTDQFYATCTDLLDERPTKFY